MLAFLAAVLVPALSTIHVVPQQDVQLLITEQCALALLEPLEIRTLAVLQVSY